MQVGSSTASPADPLVTAAAAAGGLLGRAGSTGGTWETGGTTIGTSGTLGFAELVALRPQFSPLGPSLVADRAGSIRLEVSLMRASSQTLLETASVVPVIGSRGEGSSSLFAPMPCSPLFLQWLSSDLIRTGEKSQLDPRGGRLHGSC